MSLSVTYLTQDQIRTQVHESCVKQYTKNSQPPPIPYDQNPCWQDLENRIFNILQDAKIELSKFDGEFMHAFIQASGEKRRKFKSYEPNSESSGLVSENWKSIAIALGSIVLAAIIITVAIATSLA